MEKIIISQIDITGNKPDNFAWQSVLRNFNVGYEYLMDGIWTSRPPGSKPQDKRYIFDSTSTFDAALDMYMLWTDLNTIRVDNPVSPEIIMKRASRRRISGNPLVLFAPWGVRPEGDFGAPEVSTLQRLSGIQTIFRQRNIDTTVMVMPADLYATEVNSQVSPVKAEDYFRIVNDEAQKLGFLVKPWSVIRVESQGYYSDRSRELTPDQIAQLLGKNILTEAIEASSRRSGYTTEQDIEKAACAYLRERICEAEIIEGLYTPIKVSLVVKNKDNGVDRNLPRLYVIPREERFPWLKT